MIDNFDLVVLSIVKGCKIVDSLKRLYESGDVTGEELALVVGKFARIALALQKPDLLLESAAAG